MKITLRPSDPERERARQKGEKEVVTRREKNGWELSRKKSQQQRVLIVSARFVYIHT